MKMIAILLATFLRPYMSWMEEWRNADWFERYFAMMSQRFLTLVQPDWLKLLIFMSPVVLVLVLVHWLLSGILFGLVWLILSVLTLLYTQGIYTNTHYLDRFFAAAELNDTTAMEDALAAFPASEQRFTDERSLSGQLTGHILTQANEKLFALFFWFVPTGPVGLLIYVGLLRLERWESVTHPTHTFGRLLRTLIELIEWIPARLGVLSYAIVGDFTGAIDGARKAHPGGWSENGNAQLLLMSGLGALSRTEARDTHAQDALKLLRDARDLVARSYILWLSVIAVATLAGVLG